MDTDLLDRDETHHVWVIHGTFNAPDENGLKWYQPNPSDPHNFCTRLSTALANGPLKDSVWRDVPASDVFSWTGDNDHDARVKAAEKLADRIYDLTRHSPKVRLHLVAHSHGGNVLLKAIELYRRRLIHETRSLFRDVCLKAKKKPSPAEKEALIKDVLSAEFGPDRRNWPEVCRRAMEDVLFNEDFQNVLLRNPVRRGRRFAMDFRPFRQHFVEKWVNPAVHRLGQVVFMGTPFLRKQWLRPKKRIWRLAQDVYRALPLLPFIASIWFLFFFYGPWWLLAVTPWISSPPWNPLEWPVWLMVVWLLFSLSLFFVVMAEARPHNINAYFDPEDLGDYGVRMDALVISATYLDEALVGLSSEPLVYAHLVPRIKELLYRDWDQLKQDLRLNTGSKIGEDEGLTQFLWSLTLWPVRQARNFLYSVMWPISFPVRRFLIEPYLTRMLLNIVCAAAFGMPSRELIGARIWVRHHLLIPKYFKEDFWDLTEEVLDTTRPTPPRSPALGSDLAQRYAFLTNPSVLNARRTAAEKACAQKRDDSTRGWWGSVYAMHKLLYARYERAYVDEFFVYAQLKQEQEQFINDLAQINFTIEERIKELTGAVELNHSMYYSNDKIISQIAEFLESGKRRR